MTGAVKMPARPLPLGPSSFELTAMERVGLYALALTWGDGHNSGIYSWELLRKLGT